jgi:hypothetical protein
MGPNTGTTLSDQKEIARGLIKAMMFQCRRCGSVLLSGVYSPTSRRWERAFTGRCSGCGSDKVEEVQ